MVRVWRELKTEEEHEKLGEDEEIWGEEIRYKKFGVRFPHSESSRVPFLVELPEGSLSSTVYLWSHIQIIYYASTNINNFYHVIIRISHSGSTLFSFCLYTFALF